MLNLMDGITKIFKDGGKDNMDTNVTQEEKYGFQLEEGHDWEVPGAIEVSLPESFYNGEIKADSLEVGKPTEKEPAKEITHYEIDECAMLDPYISDSYFTKLKEDIQKYGVLNPIKIYNGKIIDGKKRYQVCKELGIEPPIESVTFKDDIEKWNWVITVNGQWRNNMSPSQKAMVAARYEIHFQDLAKENQRLGKNGLANSPIHSRKEAAKICGVSEGNVGCAERVLRSGNEKLITAVDKGEIAVYLASKLVKQVKSVEEQIKILENGNIKEFLSEPRQEIPQIKKDIQFSVQEVLKTNDPETLRKVYAAIQGVLNERNDENVSSN